MSDRESKQLGHVVERLMSAQGEALYVCRQALDDLDDARWAEEASTHLESALRDVQEAILEGASQDVQGLPGGGMRGGTQGHL